MTQKKKYRPASQVVAGIVRKYGCNRAWIWDVLDEHFNMRCGDAAMMDADEIDALKEIIGEMIRNDA